MAALTTLLGDIFKKLLKKILIFFLPHLFSAIYFTFFRFLYLIPLFSRYFWATLHLLIDKLLGFDARVDCQHTASL